MNAKKRQPFRRSRGDELSTQWLRAEAGLPERNPGLVTCLQCRRTFRSWDVCRNRRCRPCHNLVESQATPEVEYDDGMVVEIAELEEIHAA